MEGQERQGPCSLVGEPDPYHIIKSSHSHQQTLMNAVQDKVGENIRKGGPPELVHQGGRVALISHLSQGDENVTVLASCPPGPVLPRKAVEQDVSLGRWPQLQTTFPASLALGVAKNYMNAASR